MRYPEPVPFVAGERPYAVPRFAGPIDLDLRANEGLRRSALPDAWSAADARVYPDRRALEVRLAARAGRPDGEILVTAGADEAIDRVCRAFLGPGRAALVPTPTFEMTARLAAATGATLDELPWPDAGFPLAALQSSVSPRTRLIVVTTPNNPTGQVASAAEIRDLAEAAPQAVVLVDLAYVEYADEDPAAALRDLPNVLLTRTFSKAWGLAGLRVGTLEGPAPLLDACRVVGLPFSVSGYALATVARLLDEDGEAVARHVARVRKERQALAEELRRLGLAVSDSQANFVFTRTARADWLRDGLGGLGIAVRGFPGKPGLADALRISCPDDADALERLTAGLRAVLAPEALLFDMDGVLADVSASYRQAIVGTAKAFGVDVTEADVERAKSAGAAANDWEVTRRLLAVRGVDVSFEEVRRVFEALYQGDDEQPGLWRRERLLPAVEVLRALRGRLPLAIVTGRPRGDAERFLDTFGLGGLFDAVVTMEDAAAKPSPEPVLRALAALGCRAAWMLGDTPDDVAAARGAGVVPLGILPPGAIEATGKALAQAGAARVLDEFSQLQELLP